MKFVSATIRPRDWHAVRTALNELGVYDISVTELRRCVSDGGRRELYRGAEYVVDHVPQSRIEMAIGDHMVALVVAAIDRAVGRCADGDYMVSALAGHTLTDDEPGARACISEEIF